MVLCCYSAPLAEQNIAMSMAVCLSARISQEPHVQTWPNFRRTILVAVARTLGSLLAPLGYVLYTSGFKHDIIFVNNTLPAEGVVEQDAYSK